MRFTPLLFAGAVAAMTRPDCFTSHSTGLAAYASCADHVSLAECFFHIQTPNKFNVEQCLLASGCSSDDASFEARAAIDRCDEWIRADELRRRAPAAAATAALLPQITIPPVLARQANNLECYTTSTVDSRVCPVETNDGTVTTQPCTTTRVAQSECAPGLTCSMDNQGNDVCMELQDTLEIAGIIISIVFGVAILLAIGTLTYMCCQDRREHRRLEAKAEATALARAATKKQRAADVRAPLMSEQPVTTPTALPGGPDPFSDRHHS
ncbi:hypothetical protein S40285_02407 [Stachybotrys chlorohalonatus IBT 40285]|uniref:Uncharacterized protein n=1 Tax=Stachybotrys chlorohalonatus (strain IBT 40285) TaxID=1283841 RepID=A0A084QPR2_STAC4|nr:hypothetical protein S40285_02407 [Stachybotrys chlorohalonata IBT 40285]